MNGMEMSEERPLVSGILGFTGRDPLVSPFGVCQTKTYGPVDALFTASFSQIEGTYVAVFVLGAGVSSLGFRRNT